MIQHQRNINMYPGVRAPERIHLSQYDSDFSLVFSLYSSAGSFTLESGTTAMIRGTKGDGNGYSASASLSGTTVTVQGNNQMTASAGPNTFELVLTRSGKVLSTANFILDVEPAAMDADTIQSETVLKELQAIIESASTSTAAATRAEEAAQEAEGHANGTVRFDIVQSKTEAEKAQARQNIGFETDNTLTVQGAAADAKKVGDEITGLKDDLGGAIRADVVQNKSVFEELLARSNIGIKISDIDRFSNALRDCIKGIPWFNNDGGNRIDMLLNSFVDLRLPDDYVRLNYIESWGNLAIDTGIQPQLSMRFHVIYSEALGVNKSGTKESFGPVICAGGTSNSRFYVIEQTVDAGVQPAMRTFKSYVCVRLGNTTHMPLLETVVWDLLVDETLQISRSGDDFTFTYNVNGVEGSETINIPNFELTSNNLFVFHTPNAYSPMEKGLTSARVYAVEIYNNSEIIFNGIPCCYLPDGVCGLYDLVTETFYPLVDYSS